MRFCEFFVHLSHYYDTNKTLIKPMHRHAKATFSLASTISNHLPKAINVVFVTEETEELLDTLPAY